MQLTANILTRAQIINGGFELTIAKAGTEWNKSQLGDYADKSGVYILHSNGQILYIGKATKGKFGTFAERLRRQCQEKAAGNSPLFQALCQCAPARVRAYLLDLEDVDMMIDPGPMKLSAPRKALMMEQLLIGLYLPPHNRADVEAEEDPT